MTQNDEKIIALLQSSDKIYISFIAYVKLLCGFKNGSRYDENIHLFIEFLIELKIEILHSTMDTIDIYSDLSKKLRTLGRPIPSNDIWIAALAIESGSVLITYDRHFNNIPGLRLFND